jgi:hypothetical protein
MATHGEGSATGPPIPTLSPVATTTFARLIEVVDLHSRDHQSLFDRQQTLLEQNNGLLTSMGEVLKKPKAESLPKPRYRQPDKFSGKQAELATFVSHVMSMFRLEPQAYPTDAIKVEALGTYLDGAPHDWFVSLRTLAVDAEKSFKTASPAAREALILLTNWDRFLAKFEAAYGDPTPFATAENRLRSLRQTGAASVYAQEWRTIAETLPLSPYEQVKRFREGLKNDVKDVLSQNPDPPDGLDEFVNLVVSIDNRLFERREEKRRDSGARPAQHPPRRDNGRRDDHNPRQQRQYDLPPVAPPPPPPIPNVSGPAPMDIDATTRGRRHSRLSQAERARRLSNNLCLYCGLPGHMAADHSRGTVNAVSIATNPIAGSSSTAVAPFGKGKAQPQV